MDVGKRAASARPVAMQPKRGARRNIDGASPKGADTRDNAVSGLTAIGAAGALAFLIRGAFQARLLPNAANSFRATLRQANK